MTTPLVPTTSGPGTSVGDLIRELARTRCGDYANGSITTTGAATLLVDNTRYEAAGYFNNAWLYYAGTQAASNTGLEKRILTYDGANTGGTFYFAGSLLTAGSVGDQYDIHTRWSHQDKLHAINRGIRALPNGFWRRVVDMSITTQQYQWAYTVPSSIQEIWGLEIQMSTIFSGSSMLSVGASGTGFPFADANYLGWSVRQGADSSGGMQRVLQFAAQPPPGRILRIYGRGIMGTVGSDLAVLSVGSDDYDSRLVEFLLDKAQRYLWEQLAASGPATDVTRAMKMMTTSGEIDPQHLVMPFPSRDSLTPGMNGQYQLSPAERTSWMSVFHGWGN